MARALFAVLEDNQDNEFIENLETEVSEMLPSEVDVVSDQAIDGINEVVEQTDIATEDINNALDYCDRLMLVSQRIQTNKSISTEDIKEIQGYANIVCEHYKVSMESICPKISTDLGYEIAVEGIAETITNIFKTANNVLSSTITSTVDTLTYSYKVIAFNSKKQKQLMNSINESGNKTKDLNLGKPSINFAYDDGKVVTSFDEYIKEYGRMSGVISNFNKISAKFVSDDLFAGIKVFFSMLTFKGDTKIEKLYDTIDKFNNTLTALDKFTILDEENGDDKTVKVKVNKTMLGNRQVGISRAETRNGKYKILITTAFLNANEDFDFNSNNVSQLIFKNVNKSDISKLLNESSDLANSIYSHKSLSGILSQLGNLGAIPGIFSIQALPSNVIWSLISRSYRAYIATQLSILHTVAVGAGYAIRQQKQALAIAERFNK